MGVKGSQTPEVVEKQTKQNLLDKARFECADAIDARLRTHTPQWLQSEYGLSAVDAMRVYQFMRSARKRLDPQGDWR